MKWDIFGLRGKQTFKDIKNWNYERFHMCNGIVILTNTLAVISTLSLQRLYWWCQVLPSRDAKVWQFFLVTGNIQATQQTSFFEELPYPLAHLFFTTDTWTVIADNCSIRSSCQIFATKPSKQNGHFQLSALGLYCLKTLKTNENSEKTVPYFRSLKRL